MENYLCKFKSTSRNEPEFEFYEDIEMIGHGAFGKVYKATDIYTQEIVALKVRFMQEFHLNFINYINPYQDLVHL